MAKWKAIIGLNNSNELLEKPLVFEKSDFSQWFYNITENNPVIIGRNTFNIFSHFKRKVLIEVSKESTNVGFSFSNLELIDKFIDLQIPTSQPFVVGGKELFESSFKFCDALIIYREEGEGIEFEFPSTFIKCCEVRLSEVILEVYSEDSDISHLQLDKIFKQDQIILKGE